VIGVEVLQAPFHDVGDAVQTVARRGKSVEPQALGPRVQVEDAVRQLDGARLRRPFGGELEAELLGDVGCDR